ncbi:MAG: hypothetical protein EZS28_011856 [Streblomastix strix]|uniref:Uncharacterized protein n=1 Tax=Streblomastix strix TaxID=222440 RepID=A0A5J4WCF0_9EUKA|nr:MAG: hypothetical protein EZS28_011856 [Streblomastix strix]
MPFELRLALIIITKTIQMALIQQLDLIDKESIARFLLDNQQQEIRDGINDRNTLCGMDLEYGRNYSQDAPRQIDQATVPTESPHSLDSIKTESSDQITSKINWKVTVPQIPISDGIISFNQVESLKGQNCSQARMGFDFLTQNWMESGIDAGLIGIATSLNIEETNESQIQQLERMESNSLRDENVQTVTCGHCSINASAAPLATAMRIIFQKVTQMGLMLHAVHIKGVDNRQADALSRLLLAGDYQIRTKYMTSTLQQLGLTLQEDMFATKEKAMCTIQYSPTQKDEAAGKGGLLAV